MVFRSPHACRCALFAALAATTSLTAPQAFAEPVLPYNIGDAVRDAEQSRRSAPLPRTTAAPVLPQLADPPLTLDDKETLFVRSFKVEGPSLGLEAEVHALLAPFERRKLTIAEIYAAADSITTLYRSRGYLVAKAYVPAQNSRNGVLRIKLVPGRYGTVTTKNESLVRDSSVQGIIDHTISPSDIIHQSQLERTMLLISDLAGAGMPQLTIAPGRKPETSDFLFDVPARPRFDGFLLGDNYGSPYTGRGRASGGFNWNSPFGFGDRLTAYGIVSNTADLVNGRVAYSTPLGYDGLRGEVAAFRTTYVLGGIYDDLGATGTANGLSGTLTYALRRQRSDSIYLWGSATHKALNDKFSGISLADRTIDLGTAGVTRDTIGAVFGLPLTTSTTFSFTAGRVDFSDPQQRAQNIAGVNTAGDFQKLNLSFLAMVAFTDRLSLTTNFRAQKSLSGNLDSSEQMSLTGYWGVRSFDEGLSGDSGYLVTPELKYALPDAHNYRHAVGVFTDIGAVWIEDASYTTTQKKRTQLNDVGLGYYGTYEYSSGRLVLLKAQVAHTYGSSDGARSYNRQTKGLFQVGLTY